jgi:hypothetical protein
MRENCAFTPNNDCLQKKLINASRKFNFDQRPMDPYLTAPLHLRRKKKYSLNITAIYLSIYPGEDL